MVHSVVLSGKGQLVIPKSLRNKYGLAKGSKLIIFDDDGKLRLELADSIVERLKVLDQHVVNGSHVAVSGDGATLPAVNGNGEKKRDAREIT